MTALLFPDTAEIDFSEFTDAARITAPAGDRLDDIEAFMHKAAHHIDQLAADFSALCKDVETCAGRGDGWNANYVFARSCAPAMLPAKVLEFAIDLVRRDFVDPKGVSVGDVSEFVAEACNIRGYNHDLTTDKLRMFSASAIRTHFAHTVGDVRETAINQLRERVMRGFGRHRPELTTHVWCSIHRAPFSIKKTASTLELTHEMRRVDEFADKVRFIMHLATGKTPSEIALPEIVGFNDAKEWDRSTVFRKQKHPFPGCGALRFCSGGGVDLTFEPGLLAKLQAQWDKAFPNGPER